MSHAKTGAIKLRKGDHSATPELGAGGAVYDAITSPNPNVQGLGHKMREVAKEIVEMEYRGRESHRKTVTRKQKQKQDDSNGIANWASYNIETIAEVNYSKMRKNVKNHNQTILLAKSVCRGGVGKFDPAGLIDVA